MDPATRDMLVRLAYLVGAVIAVYYVFTVGWVILEKSFAVLHHAEVP